MRRLSKVFLGFFILLLLFGAWAIYYAQDKGFSRHWRHFVHAEFRKRGVHATLRRLNLDPIRGLIAKDVLVYEDASHETVLMEIDKVVIDIDYSDLLDDGVSIRSVEVRDAKISIPLDPDRRTEMLRIDQFNGRILTPPDQLRIVRADGLVGGIHVSLNGSLSRPDPLPEDERNRKDGEAPFDHTRYQLSRLRSRREQIRRALEFLERFDLEPDSPPSLHLTVHGELNRPGNLHVVGDMEASPLGYQGYRCETLTASFEWSNRSLNVDSLSIEDEHGKLQAEFQFFGMDRDLHFTLASDNDLHGLLVALFDAPRLNEFVFFHPPQIELSGVYHLEKPFAWDDLPMQVLGEIRSDGLTSRGVVFSSLGCDFSIDGPKVFLRNGRLEHKSGVLSGSLLRDADGTRYQADIRLPPTVFSPFLEHQGIKQFLKRWKFTDESAVLAQIEGRGPNLSSEGWTTTGRVDLRNCQLNGHPISELQCELRLEGQDHVFSNVMLRRPEGIVRGESIHLDHENRLCHLNSVSGKVFPVHAVGWFAPRAARHLVVYQFEEPPALEIDGVIDTRPESPEKRRSSRHDYALTFQSKHPAYYELFGERIQLDEPRGKVAIRGNHILLENFRAGLLDGSLSGRVDLTRTSSDLIYEIDAQLSEVDFASLVALYDQPRDTGGRISAGGRITGREAGLDQLKAEGRALVREGDVFSIPSIGPLAKPISKALPRLHSDIHTATEASLSFTIEDGVFSTPDFAASTNAYDLRGHGDIDLRSRALDVIVSINFRNPVLLSSLMEFQGEGSLSEPVWRPRDLVRLQGEPVRKITSSAVGTLRKMGETLPNPLPFPIPLPTDRDSAPGFQGTTDEESGRPSDHRDRPLLERRPLFRRKSHAPAGEEDESNQRDSDSEPTTKTIRPPRSDSSG